MPQTTVIRNAPSHCLFNELQLFIKGALKRDRSNPLELTKTALRLLKNLPAARSALFEHFSAVFTEGAQTYILAIENEIKTGELPTPSEIDEAVLTEIHTVLTALIADNPTAWAPIVSTWSLDLLGEISTKFVGRAHVSNNLNDSLQLWMNCHATKILVDINTKCLSSLMHLNTETCINALLDTSVKHSPNFDWVVAHVGSCFPNTVITRVLSCGLKDFCQLKSYEQGSNSPKLRSVVGILGHLAGSHRADIRSAILEMFEWSLQQDQKDFDAVKLQKKATIPFILQLSFLSATLFSSICPEIPQILTVATIPKLSPFVEDWCRYFGSNEIIEDLLLTLILSCDNGGFHIINLLLDCSSIASNPTDVFIQNVKEKSLEILQNVLYRVDENVRNDKQNELLKSLVNDLDDIHKSLLSSNEIRSQIAAQIVVFVGHKDPSLLVRSVSYLLENSTTSENLSHLVKILTHELVNNTCPYNDKGGYFPVVLEQVLCRKCENFSLEQTWKNLCVLLRWEKSGRVSLLSSRMVSKAIHLNLIALTDAFRDDISSVHNIAEILSNLEIQEILESVAVEGILKLTQATINYFFICCKTDSTVSKATGFAQINRLLRCLCSHSKVARVLALRELLEKSLFQADNVLFGATLQNAYGDNSDKLLIKQNKKINKTIPLTKHSSVFNGGIIGTGKRKQQAENAIPAEEIARNTSELTEAIKSCCALPEDSEKFGVSLDSVTLLSLLLVQLVSPDVMYNGLPWPDEEFAKVTIERDLFIRKLFTNVPVLWEILNLIAVYRPALCYCSVLIRALTATLIHQWKSSGEQNQPYTTEYSKALMDMTVRVVDVMSLGQLLLPPLSRLRDVLPSLKSFEIVAVLKDCVWAYMRDNIPSPALFTCDANGIHWRDPAQSRPSEVYTNTLQIIMQRNIENLGHMYSQMFINIPKLD